MESLQKYVKKYGRIICEKAVVNVLALTNDIFFDRIVSLFKFCAVSSVGRADPS